MTARQVQPIPKKKKRGPSPSALRNKATVLWGQYVRLRDGVCQVCGRADGKLDAHHVMIREFNATRTDENNGMLVCYHCHVPILHGDPHRATAIYTRRFGIGGYQALRSKAYDGVGAKYTADYWRGEIARLTALLKEAA